MISSLTTPDGGFTTLNIPAETVAYGWGPSRSLTPDQELDKEEAAARKAGAVGHGTNPSGQLILVLKKRGESASSAMSRVGARHKGTTFKRLATDLVLDGPQFGVSDAESGEVVFDYYMTDEGIALDVDDEAEILLSRLLSGMR